ncbi:MAG TPA: hypothetical protein VNK96_00785 [Fimbriimonadales bacterium]|nr:hypothetical protein [Fimbriimonadales bacterium]
MDLGIPIVGVKPSIANRVREYLQGEDRLLLKLSPRKILEKTMREDEGEKPLEEIYEAFLKYPNLPMLESKHVLLEAIVQGVREGIFGVRVGDRVFFQESISSSQIGMDAVLVREKAEMLTPSGPVPGAGVAPPPTGVREPPVEITPPPPTEKTIKVYRLHASIPWERLSDFVRGVVTPLRQDGAEIAVEVILEAKAENGFKDNTIEHKVRETLRQIDATIVEEKDE